MKFIPSSETIRALAKYITLGGAVFALGLVWNFPYEKFGKNVSNALMRRTGYQIEMETLSPALPLGIVAQNARLKSASPAIDLKLDSVKVTISPFTPFTYLFWKSATLHYDISKEKSRFKGKAKIGKEESGFTVDAKSLKIIRSFELTLGEHGGPLPLPFDGTVTLEMELNGKTGSLQSGDLTAASGNLKLTSINTKLTVPMLKELRFDKIQIEAALDKGKLNVKSINLSGPDITGTMSGSVKLDSAMSRSQMDLEAKLTLSSKMEELKNLVNTMGSSLGLKINEQGTMAFKLTGQLESPSLRGF